MGELLSALRLRIKALFKRAQLDRDLEEELAFHLAMKQHQEQSRGFGNPTLVKETVREMWTFRRLEAWWQDVRFATRLLRRTPVFSLTAVLSLAIGIGANTAIFSLIDAVMLKQLPVEHPEQLRVLTWSAPSNLDRDLPVHSTDGYSDRTGGRESSGSFSYPAFKAFANVPLLSDVIGFSSQDLIVTAQGASEFAHGNLVSGNYFGALGVSPTVGRAILPDDDAPGRPHVAVIGYHYWTRRFGRDPAVIGQTIAVNAKPVTIVGVTPKLFLGLWPGEEPDLYVPAAIVPDIGREWLSLQKPDYWWVQVFARLRPGVTDEQAGSVLNAAYQHQIESYAWSKKQDAVPRVDIRPGARGLQQLRGDLSLPMYILAAAVALVLLIACANVANLLLARADARRREIAVRLSIGASRIRLVRQLVTEGLLLSIAGGALGLLAVHPIMNLLLWVNHDETPLEINAALDARTLLFAVVVSVLTGVFFSIIPALRATGLDLTPALKDGGRDGSRSGGRLRLARSLVACQVALSVLLLIGAGLFLRTLLRLQSVDLGFNPDNLLTFRTDPSLTGRTPEALGALYGRLRQSIEALPGVRSVALSNHGLITNGSMRNGVGIPGRVPKPGERGANVLLCSDSFLSTMRIPMLLGRDLSPADSSSAQPVAVVNDRFAKQYFPDRNPIGKEFYLGEVPTKEPHDAAIRIVGVSANAHYSNVRQDPPPTFYLPYVQHLKTAHQMTFAIRTAIPPVSLAEEVRKTVARVDPTVPVARLRTERQLIQASIGSELLFAGLVTALGVVAALLAAIGLYGVVSYSVSRRTSEIGIRLALGADVGDVLWLIVRECLSLVAAGLVIGIPAALALTGALSKMLYGVKPADALSYIGAAVLMIAIAAIAASLPARRAARIQPTVALKYE